MDQESSRSPDLDELLEEANKSFVGEIHTCLPGSIVEYYPKTQKADIKPTIQRLTVHEDGTELLESLPIIPDVPIRFTRAAGFFITFPLEKGDLVALHVCERSIDNWLSGDGGDTDPDEFRMHDLSDAFAVPGLYPFKRAIKDINSVNLVIGKDDGGIQVHITPDGTMEVQYQGIADDAVALGGALQLFWDVMFKPLYDVHTHISAVAGNPTGPPVPLAPLFDVSIISKYLKVRGK